MKTPNPYIDATTINTYITCPRMAYYQYVLGWQKEGSASHHLGFGIAWHKAMELVCLSKHETFPDLVETAERLLNAGMDWKTAVQHVVNSNEVAYKAVRSLSDTYAEYVPQDEWDAYEFKNPDRAALALLHYIDKYWNDAESYKTLRFNDIQKNDSALEMKELKGSLLLERYTIAYNVDRLAINKHGEVCVFEHKTASPSSWYGWPDTWVLNFQPFIYHIVAQTMFPDKAVKILLDGVCFHRTKIDLKRGKPTLMKHIDLDRADITHTKYTTNNLLYSLLRVLQDWENDSALLRESEETDSVLYAFPMIPKNCGYHYGRKCDYIDLCRNVPNPLVYGDNCPPGFEQKDWDPLAVEGTLVEPLTFKEG